MSPAVAFDPGTFSIGKFDFLEPGQTYRMGIPIRTPYDINKVARLADLVRSSEKAIRIFDVVKVESTPPATTTADGKNPLWYIWIYFIPKKDDSTPVIAQSGVGPQGIVVLAAVAGIILALGVALWQGGILLEKVTKGGDTLSGTFSHLSLSTVLVIGGVFAVVLLLKKG